VRNIPRHSAARFPCIVAGPAEPHACTASELLFASIAQPWPDSADATICLRSAERQIVCAMRLCVDRGVFFHVLFMLLALEAGLEAVYVSPMG